MKAFMIFYLQSTTVLGTIYLLIRIVQLYNLYTYGRDEDMDVFEDNTTNIIESCIAGVSFMSLIVHVVTHGLIFNIINKPSMGEVISIGLVTIICGLLIATQIYKLIGKIKTYNK